MPRRTGTRLLRGRLLRADQVGGSIGLAVLGTVAWTVIANATRQAASASSARATAASQAAAYRHALTVGFDRTFLVAAGISLVMLVLTIAMIRVRRTDLGTS